MLKHAIKQTGLDFGLPRPPQRQLNEQEMQEIDLLVTPILEAELLIYRPRCPRAIGLSQRALASALFDRNLAPTEIQISYQNGTDLPVIFVYVKNKKLKLDKKGIKFLTKIEKELKNYLSRKIKIYLIPKK